MKKNNIFIVEGKSDANKLKSIFGNIKVIKTNGILIDKNTIKTIKLLADNNNLIVFTDPDYAGRKIRKRINELLDGKCINVYLKNNSFEKKKSKKYGVAEAKVDDIKNSVYSTIKNINNSNDNYFTFEEYLSLELNSKDKRKYISNKLNISYFNHKQLYKILNYLNISFTELKGYINEYKKIKDRK